MPSINVSEESDSKIEEIQEEDEFTPPKRQIAEKAINEYYEDYMAENRDKSESETENTGTTQEA